MFWISSLKFDGAWKAVVWGVEVPISQARAAKVLGAWNKRGLKVEESQRDGVSTWTTGDAEECSTCGKLAPMTYDSYMGHPWRAFCGGERGSCYDIFCAGQEG